MFFIDNGSENHIARGLLMVCLHGCEGCQHAREPSFRVAASASEELSVLDGRVPRGNCHGVDANGVHVGFEQQFFGAVFPRQNSEYILASGKNGLAGRLKVVCVAEIFNIVCHGSFTGTLRGGPDRVEGVDAVDSNKVAQDCDGIDRWHVIEVGLRILYGEEASSLEVESKIVRYIMAIEST